MIKSTTNSIIYFFLKSILVKFNDNKMVSLIQSLVGLPENEPESDHELHNDQIGLVEKNK